MTTERKFPEPMTSLDSAALIADDGVGGSEELGVVDMAANGTAESQIDPLSSQPAASTEPEDTTVIFNRMGITVDLEEDVDTTEEASRNITPDPVMTEPTSDDADDALVAEYMQRLLGRSSGTPNAPLPASRGTSHSSSTERTRATSSTSTTTPSNGASNTVHERAVRQPRKPRPATVPESSCDLTAMRELANLSARGALDMHSRQRLTRDTFTKLLLVGLSLAAGISMALNASVVGLYAWVGASVCWTITVVWGAQYLCLFCMCYGYGKRGKKNQSSGGDFNDPEPVAADTAAHTGAGD